MRADASRVSISILVFLAAIGLAYGLDQVEIRSCVATYDFTWNSQSFPGFYYDADDDLGREELTATITEWNRLSGDGPYGLVYTTTAQAKRFDHARWGAYRSIGFLGKNCFAGYIKDKTISESDQIPWKVSGDVNTLSNTQLFEVLIDNDTEITITTDTPLKLAQGYQLAIRSIDEDEDRAYLELTKDGQVVDARSVYPSRSGATELERTYYYSKELGMAGKAVVIAAHFKNAFRGADQNLGTVSGLWQISEEPLEVRHGMAFDKMTVDTVDPAEGLISLANEDYFITLDSGRDMTLMPGMGLKVADSDELRYYIYREIQEPGSYVVRGSVANATGDYTWNPSNFAGFYYDPDDNLGTETLTATVTDGILSGDPPYGLSYYTTTQKNFFEFEDWGIYNIIGFMGKDYFAGYVEDSNYDESSQILFWESKKPNLLSSGQLRVVLIDDDGEKTIPKGETLQLEQGYELLIKGINQDGQVYLELKKDGNTIESKVLAPSADGATMADKTYWYFSGSEKGIVTLAVHFKNVYRDEAMAAATVDGIWQVSDQFIPVEVGSEHGRMSVTSLGSDSLTMNNKDSQIKLGRNKDISIMPWLIIRVADSDTLRYYPYSIVTVDGGVADATAGLGTENSGDRVDEGALGGLSTEVPEAVDPGI